jgi:hypothetical protein
MEEIEVPLEKVQEDLHEAAHSGPSWFIWGALLSALFAVFAAVASLMSGHHANEAVIDQILASNHWNYYQAKGIKAAIIESRHEMLKALGKEPSDKTTEKLEEYRVQQKEIQEQAKEKESGSVLHFSTHQILAKAVTLFQIAIAVTAIAVLVRRRWFLYLSGAFGVGGLFFLAQGLMNH